MAAASALLLGASASAGEAPAPSAPAISASIDLAITGLRSDKGNVLVCLSANPKFFPDCSKDKQARKLKISAVKAGTVQIADVKPGTYAVALVHDENANGKMDLRLFLPREGFGFSRNPKIGMGPPKFKSAQFTIGSDDAHYAVRMKYIL
ncbi:DUF2141 domain-containing protein [Sphingorhabdus sp. SMR4y]|uniref:DUF2141 domain-containing protein n=1 Tax=Sphingorhabdus sp. SMR4y TaxID=2584094 RepID=UPI000B5CF5BA|nr:DUF2141 domain-containing protein [Sphingorhabdus sp. SMR4y]ASK87254.1 hypothetical protein SPHFLASMR4Y_00467 [Sphingorhabdus sp. SMR4y]